MPYVVTELLQGETLREMVSRRAPTQRQVLSFAVQVAQGLDAAHGEGDRPPGPQARERLRHDGRAGEAAGLRPREAAGPADGGERGGDRVRADGSGPAGGHGRVHVPGAGAGASGGRADGRVLVRRAAVRAAVGEAPLPARDDDRDADGDPRGRAGRAREPRARHPAGALRDRADAAWRSRARRASTRPTTSRVRWRRCSRRRRERRASRRWRSGARTRGSRASRRGTRPTSSAGRPRSRPSGSGWRTGSSWRSSGPRAPGRRRSCARA